MLRPGWSVNRTDRGSPVVLLIGPRAEPFVREGATTPGYVAPWNAVIDRWTRPLPLSGADGDA